MSSAGMEPVSVTPHGDPRQVPGSISVGLKPSLQPEPPRSLIQALLAPFLAPQAGLQTSCSLAGLSISFTEEIKPQVYAYLL